MNKILYSLALLLILHLPSYAQEHTIRKQLNFDENWRFALGNASSAQKDFNYGIANLFSKTGKAVNCAVSNYFNDSNWQTVQLPHDWAVALPFVKSDNFEVVSHGFKPVGGLFPATSIGWYRKHFTLNTADSGNVFNLQFDGIYRDATVWINGFYLGNHKSGYVGISYNLTPYLNFGKENVIVVRVDATQYEGWFYEGAGIYRHVWLDKLPPVHIAKDGVFAYSTISKQSASIHSEITINNTSYTNTACSVKALLKNRQGVIIAESSPEDIVIKANSNTTSVNSFDLQNAILWDIDNPYLYHLEVQVSDKRYQQPSGSCRCWSCIARLSSILSYWFIKRNGLQRIPYKSPRPYPPIAGCLR